MEIVVTNSLSKCHSRKHWINKLKLINLLCSSLLVLSLIQCSGEDQPAEPVANASDKPSNKPVDKAKNPNDSADLNEGSEPPSLSSNESPNNPPPISGAKSMAPSAMGGTTMGSSTPNQAPMPSTNSATPTPSTKSMPSAPGRVVRYVKADKAVIKSSPNDSSSTVSTLIKGDHVVVNEAGGWGKIDNGRFVKLDELSNKVIVREKPAAAWSSPPK